MKATSTTVLTAFFLILTSSPLPAPIVEETTPIPKTKTKRHAVEAESRPKQPAASKSVSTAKVSFAGTWTGTASGRINQAVFGQKAFSSNYNLQISADERTATWTSSAWILGKFHANMQKNGRVLTWTTERHDFTGTTTVACRMEMESNGTARYSESSGLVHGMFKGAGYEITGTLVRQ